MSAAASVIVTDPLAGFSLYSDWFPSGTEMLEKPEPVDVVPVVEQHPTITGTPAVIPTVTDGFAVVPVAVFAASTGFAAHATAGENSPMDSSRSSVEAVPDRVNVTVQAPVEPAIAQKICD